MIRKAIKQAMLLRGVSAASLCRQIGISEATMSNYLSGKFQMSTGKVEALMQVLDIQVVVKNEDAKK